MKSIKNTVTYSMVEEEARYLSTKLCNTMYAIERNETLYTSMSREEGKILCGFRMGNKVI